MSASLWNPGTPVPQVNANNTLVPQVFNASAGQVLFNLTAFNYAPGTGSLIVFKNGLVLRNGTDYNETSVSSFTLTAGAVANDIIVAYGFVGITASVGSLVGALFSHDILYLADTVGKKLQQLVNVCDAPYNADDTGATDSTAAVQAAMNDSNAIYFGPGTFLLNSDTIFKSQYRKEAVIVGAGAGFTTINYAGTGSCFKASARTRLRAMGMYLNKVGGAGSSIAFDCNSLEDSFIAFNKVNGFGSAFEAGTITDGDCFRVTIAYNTCYSCTYMVRFEGTPTGLLPCNANYIIGNFNESCTNGIYIIDEGNTNVIDMNDHEGTVNFAVTISGHDNKVRAGHYEITGVKCTVSGFCNIIDDLSHAGNAGSGLIDAGYKTTRFAPRDEELKWNGQLRWKPQSIAYAASITPNAALGDQVEVGVLTGNITVNEPTNPFPGATLTFNFYQDGVGGRTVTWGGPHWRVNFPLDTTAFHWSTVTFRCDGTWWIQTAHAKQA